MIKKIQKLAEFIGPTTIGNSLPGQNTEILHIPRGNKQIWKWMGLPYPSVSIPTEKFVFWTNLDIPNMNETRVPKTFLDMFRYVATKPDITPVFLIGSPSPGIIQKEFFALNIAKLSKVMAAADAIFGAISANIALRGASGTPQLYKKIIEAISKEMGLKR